MLGATSIWRYRVSQAGYQTFQAGKNPTYILMLSISNSLFNFVFFFFSSPCEKEGHLTGSIVLVVMNKLWNGVEQVTFCQVKLPCSCFCLSDLVMLHFWILLPTLAKMINKHKNINAHKRLRPLINTSLRWPSNQYA